MREDSERGARITDWNGRTPDMRSVAITESASGLNMSLADQAIQTVHEATGQTLQCRSAEFADNSGSLGRFGTCRKRRA